MLPLFLHRRTCRKGNSLGGLATILISHSYRNFCNYDIGFITSIAASNGPNGGAYHCTGGGKFAHFAEAAKALAVRKKPNSPV